MDLATLIGIIISFVSLVGGFLLEGGHGDMLVVYTSMIIVFGGTIGATMSGFSFYELKVLPAAIRALLFHKLPSEPAVVQQIVDLAEKARREGLLALENQIEEIDDQFLKKGMQLVVDGADPEVVRSVLQTEIYSIQERHRIAQDIFEAAGGYAPTMGIIGTVMGLIHVLGNLTDPDSLGPAIAVAFTATLYGVCSANVVYFPIAARLKNISRKEITIRLLMMEGITALQAGNNPLIISEQLVAFLHPKEKQQALEHSEQGSETYEIS
ncbi:MAG: flagellar motor protein [Peptococcaceae bacterium]|nr:flagellar motor protein [Peptococcaceae bacterium]